MNENQQRTERALNDFKAKKLGTLDLATPHEFYISSTWETYILVDENKTHTIVSADDLYKFLRGK